MINPDNNSKAAIVIGASAGGVAALQILLAQLPPAFPIPILIAQHRPANGKSELISILSRACALHIKEANDGEALFAGTVYLAPANYHLLVETTATLSLSIDAPVCFSRPSIDILFESAARTFGKSLIAIVLSGANSDGSRGIKKVAQLGGTTIVQDPLEAEISTMPRAALLMVTPDYVIPLKSIGLLLRALSNVNERAETHAKR